MVEEAALLVGVGLVLELILDLLVHELSGYLDEEGDTR